MIRPLKLYGKGGAQRAGPDRREEGPGHVDQVREWLQDRKAEDPTEGPPRSTEPFTGPQWGYPRQPEDTPQEGL